MRFALFLCLLATAVAAYQPGKTYNYVFRTQVSSSLLGESPAEIQQQAATGLKAQLKLTFTNDRHAKAQLQHIRMGEMNGRTEKGQQQQIPGELFEKRQIPEELKQKMELPFSVSLVDGVVERINFHEDDSTWAKNIKRAALNMLQLNLKRNDVQALKMESSQPQDEKEQQKLSVFTIPEITLEGVCETTYTIQKRPNGQYEPEQLFNSQEESAQQLSFNVTKNVNFNKCQSTADVSFGFQQNPSQQLQCLKCLRQAETPRQNVGKTEKQEQLKLTQCQQECQTNQLGYEKDIERSTVAHFELHGNTQKYSIRRSKVISQYVVKGQNPAAQNTISQVVAVSELVFKQEEQDETPVPSFKESSQPETLMYSPEWDLEEKRFYMWGDEVFDQKRASPFNKVAQKTEKAIHYLKEIIKQWIQDKEMGYELNSALLFNKLVQIVRQSSTKELKQIQEQLPQSVRSFSENAEEQHRPVEQAKSIFQDALAVAATRNSIQLLAEKIKQREISTLKAAELIKVFIANQHSPSDRQADILEKIAVSEPAQNCQVLKQTAWLAHGQAVGRICQKQPAQSQKNQFRVEELCPESKKDLYKKTLLLQWKQAESVYEQILALKVIGNSALENTVEELQKIVTDKRQPTLIRMEAIDALRRMRTSVPEKIQQTLLPVFQDQREQPEIRMAAVSMLLYTQPAPVILDQLVFSVQNDRSQNVKSFVLTALESLSQSPVNAEQQVAKHLKSALKIVKITPEQMRASRKYRVPIYVSEQQSTEEQNLLLGLASIVSPSNLIPVHLSASLRSAFNGDATQEKLQLSFSQKDLEQLYEKVANVFERFNEENLESSEERQSAKDLRQIYSSLGIKSRRTGSYYLSSEESDDESSESAKRSSKLGNNSPFGMIVIRTNDVDQVIIPIDEQKLPQIIRKFVNGEKPSFASQFGEWRDQIALGKRFHQHVALNLGETKVKLPTTAGLPLAIICQTSAVGSVEGKVKVEIESSRRASGHLEIRTSGIATHLHKTEVWSPIVVSGVKTLRTVEINHAPMKLSVQVGEDQIKIVVQPPKQQQKERVLGIHTLPATYTQKFQWESRDYAEPRLMTIRNFALEHTRQEYHLEEQRNRAVRIEGDIHRVKSAKQLLHALYTTENNLHVFYNPTERTPEELILRISGFSFRPTGQNEHQKPEFNDFFSESKSSQRKSFRSIYDDSEEQDYKQIEMHGNEERQSRLSSFVEKYQTGKAFNHQLKLQFEARTPSKSHTAELQVQARCDQWLQHCTSTLNVARSPVGEETSEWQLQAKLQTVAPENVRNSEEPDQKHSRMLVKAEAEWGPSNMQSNRVEIRLQGEPTRKTYWRSDASDKWSRFLNKFDLVADYKLHSAQRHVVQRAFELLKAQYFWQLSTDSTRQGEPNTVRATLVIDPITRRHANLTVQTPEERVRGQMIELPIKVQGYSLERRQNKYQSFGQLVQSYTQQGSAECRADDRRVRTFDGVAYRAPMSECWTVLAKDCSRENPRFVVLMKKTEEEKRVKIITQENTIELQKQPNKFIVKIDGQQVTDEEKLSEFGVEKSSFQVEVSQRGVHVRFDGNMATIKVGGLYKNIQCGLCGHYSEEEEDVFRTSDNKRSQNLKEFHQSYTLKNQECEEQKLNKFYQERGSEEFQIKQRKPQPSFRQGSYYDDSEDSFERQENQWWSSSEEDKENKQKNNPVDQTKVLEYEHKICFSSKPVKRCPSGTTQDENSEPKQVKVQFFCLNRSSTEARHLARQVRNGQIVDPAGHQLSFFDTVEQPTKCQSSDFY